MLILYVYSLVIFTVSEKLTSPTKFDISKNRNYNPKNKIHRFDETTFRQKMSGKKTLEKL